VSVTRTSFIHRTVDELAIGDESSLRHVGVYADLKEILRRADYPFRILPKSRAPRTDRALLLNLTFWSPDAGGDLLVEDRIEADVVAHAAWHHLAARALATNVGATPSVDALFLGEAIASAFDIYLVGRLLGHAPRSAFLASQVPAMAEAASTAGLSARAFERLLGGVAEDPDRAFADLRELLFDAAAALCTCITAEQGYAALAALDGHRFSALLHRYEISNWVLYARAYGAKARVDARARSVDRALRRAKAPLEWLAEHWIAPALSASSEPDSRRGRSRPRSA
jgi:hypothetical protein